MGIIRTLSFLILLVIFIGCKSRSYNPETDRPNILFIITDDQSWEHVGCYGDSAVRTPAMNRLAKEGVRFDNAYSPCPSCSPARAGILSGQDVYRLEEGGVLTGFIRDKFVLFPKLLEENGYWVGSTGKRYWPRTKNVADAVDEPIGMVYQNNRLKSPPEGISRIDYQADFDQFLDEIPDQKPFFFWGGTGEPHRPYEANRGVETGIDTAKIRVPSFLPDIPATRLDIADYLSEIEWADHAIGEMIKSLESRGLKENTLIIVTSDNGMPMPRSKATLYDHGVRMPLIISWNKQVNKNRYVTDPVNLIDLAPTFLDLIGLEIPQQMTGKSIQDLLFSKKSGSINDEREFVVSTFEKHTLCRPDSMGFPRRAIHTEEWTYIINFEPDRFPMGNENLFISGWDVLGDTDPGPIKTFLKINKTNPAVEPFWELSFGKVPGEQLFSKVDDPDMINNLAYDPKYREIVNDLRTKLNNYLKATNDPRMNGKSPWEDYNLDK